MKSHFSLGIAGALLASSVISLAQPVITNQPLSQSVIQGGLVTFWVGARGIEPLSYQWQQAYDYVNFFERPGANNYVLTITNVQVSELPYYRVVVTNMEGAVTSAVAQLIVWVPPYIASYGQPTNFPSVSLGASVTNRVLAGGSMPLAYQWRHDGVPLPGKTANTIVLNNIVAADAGAYDVVVTNVGGSVTSSVTVLTPDQTWVVVTNLGPGVSDMWLPYWVDLEGDGWLDLVATGGYFTGNGLPLMVFQNNHGTLSRTLTHDLSKTYGRFGNIAWGDFDNDGDLDGCLGSVESQVPIYVRNDGGGKFTRIFANATWTANRIPAYGSCATSADFENDGFLDILLGYWGNYATGVWGTNTVLHGLGGGLFEVDRTSALALTGTYTENFSWADWNEDGLLDLLAVTSGSSSQYDLMFQNLGGGQFLRITNSPLVQVPDISINGAWADYDNDGDLDVCVTRRSKTNQLYLNRGGGVFELDVASPLFPGGDGRSVNAWADYDNDGWLDLFVASYSKRGRLFHNRGDGRLEEVITGSPAIESQGYGCAWGDYDNDGFPDLVVIGYNNGRNYLYRNHLKDAGNTNSWLKVRLVGKVSNQSGIGARVRIKAALASGQTWQMRQITSNTADPTLLASFGLGPAANVDLVRIEWPSGIVQELQNVPANQYLTVVESQGYTGAPPQLSGAVKVTGGIGLSIAEPTSGARYILEASTNLVDWTKLMARTSAGGSYQFTDTRSTNFTRRFYRLQVP